MIRANQAIRTNLRTLGPSKINNNPDPPIIVFCFPCLFCFPIFLAFWGLLPFFSKDFRGSAKREALAFFRGFPCFFSGKQGSEGQGI